MENEVQDAELVNAQRSSRLEGVDIVDGPRLLGGDRLHKIVFRKQDGGLGKGVLEAKFFAEV